MTRIISGSFRGKQIRAPRNLPVRPTTDFAKESLFNILNNQYYFDELKVLDLFSGTGNLGYEFVSRGCTNITCVDKNPGCVRFIAKTFEQLQVDGFRAIQADSLDYLRRDFQQYNLIIADPPYDYEQYEELVELIFTKNLLAEDGMLVVEHQARKKLDQLKHFVNSRKYGNAAFSFFHAPDAE
jgi:16S rRNA (guanine(966)-N(2))-methyltransferase RsmD